MALRMTCVVAFAEISSERRLHSSGGVFLLYRLGWLDVDSIAFGTCSCISTSPLMLGA